MEVYLEKIKDIKETDIYSLIIEGDHLFQFDKKLLDSN